MYDLIIMLIESSSIIITFASSHMSRSESTEFAPTTDDVRVSQQKQNIEEGEREIIFQENIEFGRKEKMRNHIPSIWRYTLVLDSRVKAKSIKDSKQHKLLFSCESTMTLTEMFNKVRTKSWFLHQKKVTFIFNTPNYGDKRSYDKLGLNLPAQMLLSGRTCQKVLLHHQPFWDYFRYNLELTQSTDSPSPLSFQLLWASALHSNGYLPTIGSQG